MTLQSERPAVHAQGPLSGKIALVTGGGGGLGREICMRLASDGARVIAADVRVEAAEAVRRFGAESGLDVTALGMDLLSDESVARGFEEVVAAHGRIDILVNNAGIDVTLPIDELTLEQWDKVVGVNLRAPFVASRHAFAQMKTSGGGAIVNIVSTAARRAWANASVYHASKWGLLGLSHALHVEGRPHKIRVSAVIAGGMRTPFLLDRFSDIDPSVLQEPAAVANAVAFVLSQPPGTVIPEIMVLPNEESSWP